MKTNLLSKFKQISYRLISALMLTALGNVSAQTNATQRVYANVQQNNVAGVLSSVKNAGNAADGNSIDSAYFATGVAGSATQFLEFTSGGNPVTIKAGTPIYIKFGTPTAVLSALQSLTIAPFTNLHDNVVLGIHNWTATAGQPSLSGSASLLSLLGGAGTNELKVVPQTDCNGLSISLSGLNVGANFSVFSAYYLDTLTTPAGCPLPVDVLSGVNGNGINAANITSSVTSNRNAIDGNISTAATINLGANVLSQTYLTAILNSPAKAGDSVKILLQDNGTLLTINALTNFKIVTYNGSTVVDTLSASNDLLSISLLNGTGHINVLKYRAPHSFDRVGIVFGGLAGANLLSSTKIYEISTTTPAPILANGSSSLYNQYSYAGNADTLNATKNAAGDDIVWTNSSGSPASTSIPSSQAPGTYTYYALSSRDGCTDKSDTAKLNLHIIAVNNGPADPDTATIDSAYDFNATISSPAGLPNTPHFVYSLGDGTELPAGLTLNSQGQIVGTPEGPTGNYTFTIHIEDDANKDASGNNLVVGDFEKTIFVNSSNALPITLQRNSFIATLDKNKNVVLSWKTVTEINSSKFDVQSSTDGHNFKTIGSVNAAGNSSSILPYSFTDKGAFGLTYYQLLLIDLDGTTATSDIINIDNQKSASARIVPNPAKDNITISADVRSVRIFNAAGKLVLTSSSSQINVGKLPSGIYFVSILQNDGSTIKSKLIKQ